jgi:hypothetical protein
MGQCPSEGACHGPINTSRYPSDSTGSGGHRQHWSPRRQRGFPAILEDAVVISPVI